MSVILRAKQKQKLHTYSLTNLVDIFQLRPDSRSYLFFCPRHERTCLDLKRAMKIDDGNRRVAQRNVPHFTLLELAHGLNELFVAVVAHALSCAGAIGIVGSSVCQPA